LPWIAIIALALIAFFAFRSCKREGAVAPMAAVAPSMEMPDAGAALDALMGRTFSADELVKALNLMTIHFDTGSARISADSTALLAKAASVIKKAPAGTRIEVGGHTDNTGDAAANMTLSRERAAAVVAELTRDGVDPANLTSQGYGQDRPVADNTTEAGRAKNRRMEFTVLH
jgi:outer membrane protein OmpA-like peptidoglycan-associated protein